MQINWLGIGLGLVAGMAVAGVWYGKLFVQLWWDLTGITPQQTKAASRRNMVQLLIANAVTALGLGFAVAVVDAATGTQSVWLALLVGAVAALTLSVTTLLQHNAFELKPAKLTLLNCAYQLALFLATSLMIGLVRV